MKVTVEDITPLKKKMNVEVPEDLVTKEINAIYQDLGKKAKIKGFRPGKVPRNILERYYRDYVKAEVIQKLIQDLYPQALSEVSLHPVSQPVIDPGDLEKEKPFQFSAAFEIKPDIKLEGYIGVEIEGKKEPVTEGEVEERLKGLQNLHAQLKTLLEPRPIQNGDYAIIDYEASIGGKPLEGGKALDYTIEVGSGRFIPAFEEKLVGLKPEEEREIEVTFPGDYGYQKWAGKTISFRVKIKEVKEKILPSLDDEFAKDVGDFSSLEELKAKLREEIQKEKERLLERQSKDRIIDHLIETNPFEIPESLVEEQAKSLVSQTKMRLTSQGLDLKNLGVTEEKLLEDYREPAKKQVRTFLILEKIAAQEGITVTPEEVDSRLHDIADRINQKFDAIKKYYEKNGLIPEVEAEILNDKTLTFLLEKANITYS
jgi:trigger factor